MKKCYPLFLTLVGLLLGNSGYAQGIVRGMVVDKWGSSALRGATIMILGTTTGVATDTDGTFSIALPQPTAVLEISMIGYVTKRMKVRAGDQVIIELKSNCHADFFYNRYVGLGLYSGLKHAPWGGDLDLFYPHLFPSERFQPAIRLETGFQAGNGNQQRYSSLGLSELFVTCDYNLDVAFDYQAIHLGRKAFDFERRSFTLNADGLLWRGGSSLGIGKAAYLLADGSQTNYGVEAGTKYSLFQHFPIIVSGKAAWWQVCW